MPLRRSPRRGPGLVCAGLLAVCLSSCGFDLATDRVNNIAEGTEDRDATVDILSALIVSSEDGSGTFVATFVNNDTDEEAAVESIAPDPGGVGNDPDQVASVAEFPPITIDPSGLVNLAAEEPVGVAMDGEFGAGDVVALTIGLSGGQTVNIDVPVVANCGMYAGLDGPGGECEVAEPVGDHG